MNEDERAQHGWNNLAKYLGCSKMKIRSKRKELIECGVVIPEYKGRPPRETIMWFPTMIQKYLGLLAKKGRRF